MVVSNKRGIDPGMLAIEFFSLQKVKHLRLSGTCDKSRSAKRKLSSVVRHVHFGHDRYIEVQLSIMCLALCASKLHSILSGGSP